MEQAGEVPKVLDEVTPEAIRSLVLTDNAAVQSEFASRYPAEIDRAAKAISEAYSELAPFRSRLSGNLRPATIEMFFHSAVYSLVSAFHHLVSGYPIATGHMLRHFVESVAMVLLCTDSKSQVLEEFTKDLRNYSVSSAPTKLRGRKIRSRLKNLIGFDPGAWELILEHSAEYSGRSHTTGLTLAFQTMLDSDNMLILGGEFDPAKDVAYQSDLGRIASAADSLGQLIIDVTEALADAELRGRSSRRGRDV